MELNTDTHNTSQILYLILKMVKIAVTNNNGKKKKRIKKLHIIRAVALTRFGLLYLLRIVHNLIRRSASTEIRLSFTSTLNSWIVVNRNLLDFETAV